MRSVFVCVECAARYLPPESMTYPAAGVQASPVWCGVCQARHAGHGIQASPEQVRTALALARRNAPPAAAEEQPRPDVRPTRPARTRRPRKPAGRRSKLG